MEYAHFWTVREKKLLHRAPDGVDRPPGWRARGADERSGRRILENQLILMYKNVHILWPLFVPYIFVHARHDHQSA